MDEVREEDDADEVEEGDEVEREDDVAGLSRESGPATSAVRFVEGSAIIFACSEDDKEDEEEGEEEVVNESVRAPSRTI